MEAPGLSGFSEIAQKAMMQPQEALEEIKTRKNQLFIGIPKETSFQENRIALRHFLLLCWYAMIIGWS